MQKEDKKGCERYIRESYSTAEKICKKYMEIRDLVNNVENIKYDLKDNCDTQDFKQGVIAGINLMMSIFLDV